MCVVLFFEFLQSKFVRVKKFRQEGKKEFVAVMKRVNGKKTVSLSILPLSLSFAPIFCKNKCSWKARAGMWHGAPRGAMSMKQRNVRGKENEKKKLKNHFRVRKKKKKLFLSSSRSQKNFFFLLLDLSPR